MKIDEMLTLMYLVLSKSVTSKARSVDLSLAQWCDIADEMGGRSWKSVKNYWDGTIHPILASYQEG